MLFLTMALGCKPNVEPAISVIEPVPSRPETVLVLPVAFSAEMNEDSAKINRLLARGGLLKAFEERSINVLTSAMTDAYAAQNNVDVASPANWTKDRFVAMGKQLKPTYIATINVLKVQTEEGTIQTASGAIAPGTQLATTVTFEVNLFEVRSGKFIFEKSSASYKRTVGRPGPSDKQVTQEIQTALIEGAAKGFEPFLKKRALVKPKNAKKPVPDSSGG
ncbi:MAG: hypothetical protein ABL949_13380 [Fimbriimonadaceae bacterium]